MESDQQKFGYNDSNKFGPVSQELVEVKDSKQMTELEQATDVALVFINTSSDAVKFLFLSLPLFPPPPPPGQGDLPVGQPGESLGGVPQGHRVGAARECQEEAQSGGAGRAGG